MRWIDVYGTWAFSGLDCAIAVEKEPAAAAREMPPCVKKFRLFIIYSTRAPGQIDTKLRYFVAGYTFIRNLINLIIKVTERFIHLFWVSRLSECTPPTQ